MHDISRIISHGVIWEETAIRETVLHYTMEHVNSSADIFIYLVALRLCS